jgi:hypothetical protein
VREICERYGLPYNTGWTTVPDKPSTVEGDRVLRVA